MNEIDYQNEISRLFSELEEIIRRNDIERVDIRFPRGVIRTAKSFRDEMYFIDDHTFKSNLAYHLMLTDIYRWILNRFDIALTAQEMLIKECICIIGGICGDISQHIAITLIHKNKIGVSGSLTILKDNDIIDAELKKSLKYLWGQRNKLHLSTVRVRELGVYNLDKYNEAISTWKQFKISLQKSRDENRI
jgi:hypothetical protein